MTALFTLIAGVLGVIAVVIQVLWERRQQSQSVDNDPKRDIEETQAAATAGDEATVQSNWTAWTQKGRRRDPRGAGAAGLHIFDPAAESDRSTGGGRPPQNPTGRDQRV